MAEENKKKRNLWRPLLSAVGVLLLAAIAVVLIANRKDLSAQGLKRFFRFGRSGSASEIAVGMDTSASSAVLGDTLVLYGGGEIAMYGKDGSQLLYLVEKADDPALCASNKYALAYGIGGKRAVLLTSKGDSRVIKTEDPILAASVSDGGAALTTQSGGYKGVVTVYDTSGRAVYKWSSASAYVTAAAVSPSGKRLAVAGLGREGAKVTFFSLDSEQEKAVCAVGEDMLAELRFLSEERLAAVSPKGAYMISWAGEAKGFYDLGGAALLDYAFGDGFAVLLSAADKWSGTAHVAVLESSGSVSGEMDIVSEDPRVSAAGENIAVLSAGNMAVYGAKLGEAYSGCEAPGAKKALACRSGAVYLISDYLAQRFVP